MGWHPSRDLVSWLAHIALVELDFAPDTNTPDKPKARKGILTKEPRNDSAKTGSRDRRLASRKRVLSNHILTSRVTPDGDAKSAMQSVSHRYHAMLCARMKQIHTWSRRSPGLTYIGGEADLRSRSQKVLGLFANRR
jgi:hypothetical protein